MDIKQTIENYDIVLHRFTEEKQEQVRQWRNDPKIAQYMDYQKEITPEQQIQWFHRINNESNLYYIIEYQGIESGVINIKDIDKEYNSGEGGIYIYEDRFLNTDISYRAHIALFDYAFNELHLQNITSKIQDSNTRAKRFAYFLGSEMLSNEDGFTHWNLTKEAYLNNNNRIRFIRKYNRLNNK